MPYPENDDQALVEDLVKFVIEHPGVEKAKKRGPEICLRTGEDDG